MIWRFSAFLLLGWLILAGNPAGAAGPFTYRFPPSPGGDPAAVTVVGQPQTHHIVRYENLYKIAREYDLGFWELARSPHWIISICPGKPISSSPPSGSWVRP